MGRLDANERMRSLGVVEFNKRVDKTKTTKAPRIARAASVPEGVADGSEAWPELVPLDDGPLPPFPVEKLPRWLGEYVDALATFTQTPPDMSAMLVLAVVGAAVAKRVRVQVRPDYAEPANLFVVVAMPPASRKSAVFAAVQAPLRAYERAEQERMRGAVEQAASARRIAEARLKAAEGQAAKASGTETKAAQAECDDLAAALARLPMLTLPRLLAADVTPEVCASLLADNGGRLAIMSAEGGIFPTLAGRYSRGVPNLEAFLMGHAGDDLRVDRRGRAEYVERPALTMGLAVQPDVLRSLAERREFVERGLVARILFALPRSTVGSRDVDPPPMPSDVAAEYERRVGALLALEPSKGDEYEVTLGPNADAIRLDFAHEVEAQLKEGGDLAAIDKWAGKLGGACSRIALGLHCATYAGEREPWTVPIAAATYAAAVEIGRYLIPHAFAAHGVMVDGDGARSLADARHVRAWIERHGAERVTYRDVQRGPKYYFRGDGSPERLRAALDTLVEHGHLRHVADAKQSGGGRPSEGSFVASPSWRASWGR